MAVQEQVEVALSGVPEDWRTALARTLAGELDREPNASIARELRAVMGAIDAGRPPETKGTPLDELHKRREGRESGSDGGSGSGGGVVGG